MLATEQMLPCFICRTADWVVSYSAFVEFLLLVASTKPIMHKLYKSNLGIKSLVFKGCAKTVPIDGIHGWNSKSHLSLGIGCKLELLYEPQIHFCNLLVIGTSLMIMCASTDGNCGGDD